MEGKKSFNTPKKSSKKPDTKKTTQAPVSLSDDRYEEIFRAVLQPSQEAVDIKSPTIATAADYPENKAASPKESASVENSQNTQPETKKEETAVSLAKNQESSSISTLNSEDITKGAVFSTPKPKTKTFREAMKSLQQKLSESFSEGSVNESFSNPAITRILNEGELSQAPVQCSRRERLLWLQERRGTGLYVRCDHSTCRKWRWLENPDPVDLPRQWFCYMNPDKKYASCSVREKPIPQYIEEDLIHNCYTAGSIVWAKMPGYPWWPAMVDDCPDVEQYYWMNNELDEVPDWYHVVFFDDREITRHWMLVKDIKSFKHYPDLDKSFGQIFKRRMNIAKQKANHALTLHIKDRLKIYSFISTWKKEIPDYPDSDVSDCEIDDTDPNYENVMKKKIIARRRAFIRNNKQYNHSQQSSTYKNDSEKSLSQGREVKDDSFTSEKSTRAKKISKDSKTIKKVTQRTKKDSTKIVRVTKNMKNPADSTKETRVSKDFNADSAVEEAHQINKDGAISEKSSEETQKKDSKISENSAKIMSADSHTEKPAEEIHTHSSDTKVSAKSATVASKISTDSDSLEKVAKARRISKDSKVSEKSPNEDSAASEKASKKIRRTSKDSKSSEKSVRVTRRMSADSVDSVTFVAASNTSEKASKNARRTSKDSKASEKSAKEASRMSTDSDTSEKASKKARRTSKDSKASEKSIRVTRRMSADSVDSVTFVAASNTSEKASKNARRTSKDSKASEKSAKEASRMSTDSDTSEKASKKARRTSKDSKASEKSVRVTRRMSADSDDSLTFVAASDTSEKASKNARRTSKDSKASEKSAKEASRMSTDSDTSEKASKKARRTSKDSKASEKSLRVTRRMSADSDTSEKASKKARRTSKDSKSSEKSARVTRRMSADSDDSVTFVAAHKKSTKSDISVKPAKVARKQSTNSNNLENVVRTSIESNEDIIPATQIPVKQKKEPKKVTKPGKPENPKKSPVRRNSEESLSQPEKVTETRRKSAPAHEIGKHFEEKKTSADVVKPVKISKRKSIASPTFYEDEEMAKRQKMCEEKPSKMERLIKKVKNTFRPPIKTNLNSSSSTLSTLSFNDD